MVEGDAGQRVRVSGAVLTGGASRRMGRAKAWIPVDGRPMAARVADALAGAGCDPVVLVGVPPADSPPADPPPADSPPADPRTHPRTHPCAVSGTGDEPGTGADPDTGHVVVPDVRPDQGPVVGLLTALRHARGVEGVDRIVVAACDLPRLDAVIVRRLLAAGDRGARAVVAAPGGRPVPLGWWSPAVLGDLEALVTAGVRAWHEAVAGVGATLVEIDDAALSDVDTPADLERVAGRRGPDGR